VYNPWINLPPSLDKLKYPANANVANQDEIDKGNQIAFPIDVGDSAGVDAIFSNCISKEYDFCIVDYPGFVSTANCPEVLSLIGGIRPLMYSSLTCIIIRPIKLSPEFFCGAELSVLSQPIAHPLQILPTHVNSCVLLKVHLRTLVFLSLIILLLQT
jgi:hypothetical protein